MKQQSLTVLSFFASLWEVAVVLAAVWCVEVKDGARRCVDCRVTVMMVEM